MRSGSDSGGGEQTQLRASQLISYMSSLQTQVLRMRLSQGIDPLALQTATPVYTLGPIGTQTTNCWNDNTNCSSASCRIFNASNPDGVVPRVFGPEFVTTGAGIAGRVTPGHLGKRLMSINGIGTAASDLVFYIAYIRADVCNAINAKMGMTTNFTEAQFYPIGGEQGTSVGGNFGGCGSPAIWDDSFPVSGDQYTPLTGQNTFCIPFDTASPGLALFQVIIPR